MEPFLDALSSGDLPAARHFMAWHGLTLVPQLRPTLWAAACGVPAALEAGAPPGLTVVAPASPGRGGHRSGRHSGRMQLAPQLGDIARQVELDVKRGLHFDVCGPWAPGTRHSCVSALWDEVMAAFPVSSASVEGRPGAPHYYQGIHDVASVLLLSLPRAGAAGRLLAALTGASSTAPPSAALLRGFVAPTLEGALRVLDLLYPLLGRVDARLADTLREGLGLPTPHFALSWVLTWFAHDTRMYGASARIFDAVLGVGHPLFPLYVAAAMLLAGRQHIYAEVGLNPDGSQPGGAWEPDIGLAFRALARLPALLTGEEEGGVGSRTPPGVAPVEDVTRAALRLFARVPPAALLARVPEELSSALEADWGGSWGVYPGHDDGLVGGRRPPSGKTPALLEGGGGAWAGLRSSVPPALRLPQPLASLLLRWGSTRGEAASSAAAFRGAGGASGLALHLAVYRSAASERDRHRGRGRRSTRLPLLPPSSSPSSPPLIRAYSLALGLLFDTASPLHTTAAAAATAASPPEADGATTTDALTARTASSNAAVASFPDTPLWMRLLAGSEEADAAAALASGLCCGREEEEEEDRAAELGPLTLVRALQQALQREAASSGSDAAGLRHRRGRGAAPAAAVEAGGAVPQKAEPRHPPGSPLASYLLAGATLAAMLMAYTHALLASLQQ